MKSHPHNGNPAIRSSAGNYRPEIDGIRALAVIAVIVNHFSKSLLPGGYLGVDMFFVISGYVITSSLYRTKEESFGGFAVGFYERRIKRLAPALAVFVLAASLVIAVVNPDSGSQLSMGSKALLGISNIAFYLNSVDYFAQSTELNIFTHTWSLGVEEQFYILFPLLIWFSGYAKQKKNGARVLLFGISALTASSLVLFKYLLAVNQPAAYFLMPPRFWEISAGCLVFVLLEQGTLIGKALNSVSPVLPTLLIIILMLVGVENSFIPTVAVVLTTSTLISSLKQGAFPFSFFASRPVVYVGLISYSLYLWHWGVLALSRWTIGTPLWAVPWQVVLMFSLAAVSYRWIECPFRKNKLSDSKIGNIGCAIGVISLFSIAISALPGKNLSMLFDRVYPPRYRLPGNPLAHLPCHSPPNPLASFDKCMQDNTSVSPNPKIFLIGDSHASSHYWSLKEAISSKSAAIQIHVLAENGFINALVGQDSCDGFDRCIRGAWLKYLRFFRDKLSPGDYIFIGYSRDRVSEGSFLGYPRQPNKALLRAMKLRIAELAAVARSKSAYVVLIGDLPKVCADSANLSRIARYGLLSECTVARKISLQDRKALTDVFMAVDGKFNNVIYADPHDALCLGDQCSLVGRGGMFLYLDSSPHFTDNSKTYLAEWWSGFIDLHDILNLAKAR